MDLTGACCNTKKFQPVTHVIFDLDGTILDTECVYVKAFNNIAEEFGKYCTEELIMKIAGSVERKGAQAAIENLDLPLTVDEFVIKLNSLTNRELPHCSFMPGAEKAIRHLFENNVPIAIATSSSKESVELKFQNYQEIYRMFHHVVSGGSDPAVLRSKPAPDIFLVCAGRFPGNPPVSKCLVFEDSVNGVKAAVAAGMQVVMIPESHVPYEFWKLATLRLDSLNGMNFGLFGLPPYPEEYGSVNLESLTDWKFSNASTEYFDTK